MMVPTDKLEPGMVVAVDIMNMNNMLLIAKDTVLVARSIRLLKTWGIEAINIVGEDVSSSQAESIIIPSEIMQMAEALIQTRFMHVNAAGGVAKAVRTMAVKRVARRLYMQANNLKK